MAGARRAAPVDDRARRRLRPVARRVLPRASPLGVRRYPAGGQFSQPGTHESRPEQQHRAASVPHSDTYPDVGSAADTDGCVAPFGDHVSRTTARLNELARTEQPLHIPDRTIIAGSPADQFTCTELTGTDVTGTDLTTTDLATTDLTTTELTPPRRGAAAGLQRGALGSSRVTPDRV